MGYSTTELTRGGVAPRRHYQQARREPAPVPVLHAPRVALPVAGAGGLAGGGARDATPLFTLACGPPPPQVPEAQLDKFGFMDDDESLCDAQTPYIYPGQPANATFRCRQTCVGGPAGACGYTVLTARRGGATPQVPLDGEPAGRCARQRDVAAACQGVVGRHAHGAVQVRLPRWWVVLGAVCSVSPGVGVCGCLGVGVGGASDNGTCASGDDALAHAYTHSCCRCWRRLPPDAARERRQQFPNAGRQVPAV